MCVRGSWINDLDPNPSAVVVLLKITLQEFAGLVRGCCTVRVTTLSAARLSYSHVPIIPTGMLPMQTA